MKKTFYITTPIYYVSGKFHIGSAYTTCFCDTLRRYKDLREYDTYFLTGTDEHGQKIQEAAKNNNMSPQDHVDYIAKMAQDLWNLLKISNDDFIRTTEMRHQEVAQALFENLLKKGDIYLGEYSGHYCIHCEAYFRPQQLVNNALCPDCLRETEVITEETYFFRLSKYQERLLKYIEDNPNFIIPETRRNEVVQFIKSGLQDLSVSRTSFSWGIPVLSNPKHVIYVWIDALSNYISALGYLKTNDTLYQKYWLNGDEVVHVIGKDILRFHAIYWPILLMALEVPIKFRLYVHGWYLMKDGKMSKSKGNVIYPDFLVSHYGLDAFRYYIVKELPFANDGVFTPEDYLSRYNTDLVNDYGNLVSRTIVMANKYFNGTVSKTKHNHTYHAYEIEHEKLIKESVKAYYSLMDEFKVSLALNEVSKIIGRTNKLIDDTFPWELEKANEKLVLESVLYHLLEGIRIATTLYLPFLIDSSLKVFQMLGIEENMQNFNSLVFGKIEAYHVQSKIDHLFPRLDYEAELKVIQNAMRLHDKNNDLQNKAEIPFSVFETLDIRIGEILECHHHKNAKNLLVLQIDTGDKVRQVVSGIANDYQPSELVEKKVLVITNLQPIKLRGEISEGMILCYDEKDKIVVLMAPENASPGAIVR